MKSVLEKLILIIGISLIIASIASYVMREERYFLLYRNEIGKQTRLELTEYDYNHNYKGSPEVIIKTDLGYQWGVLLFVFSSGLGLVLSFVLNVRKSSKLNQNSRVRSRTLKYKLDSTYKSLSKIVVHRLHLDNGLPFSSKINLKDSDNIITLMLVLFFSALYITSKLFFDNPLYDATLRNNEAILQFIILLLTPVLTLAVGFLISIITFFYNGQFREPFHLITRIISAIFLSLATMSALD